MDNTLIPISFYIPQPDLPTVALPQDMSAYWQWQKSTKGEYQTGKYGWTLQTYIYLKAAGFPCNLVGSMPSQGIVIAHRDFLPFTLRPSAQVLLICIQADRPKHPYAQIHIVQNFQDQQLKEPSHLGTRYYIPHWPQPELIPRDSSRGDRFENVSYFGITYNLAPELKRSAWREELKALGLSWQVIQPDEWNDYSNVDVVVGVRSFDYAGKYLWKPPSKLFNAWHAGVPAILGPESAFKAERKSELDYIEVTSINELISALKHLKHNVELRRAMAENGKLRAQETQPDKLVTKWIDFFTNVSMPAYARWCGAPDWTRQLFLQRSYLKIKMSGIQRRLQLVKSPLSEDSNWN